MTKTILYRDNSTHKTSVSNASRVIELALDSRQYEPEKAVTLLKSIYIGKSFTEQIIIEDIIQDNHAVLLPFKNRYFKKVNSIAVDYNIDVVVPCSYPVEGFEGVYSRDKVIQEEINSIRTIYEYTSIANNVGNTLNPVVPLETPIGWLSYIDTTDDKYSIMLAASSDFIATSMGALFLSSSERKLFDFYANTRSNRPRYSLKFGIRNLKVEDGLLCCGTNLSVILYFGLLFIISLRLRGYSFSLEYTISDDHTSKQWCFCPNFDNYIDRYLLACLAKEIS